MAKSKQGVASNDADCLSVLQTHCETEPRRVHCQKPYRGAHCECGRVGRPHGGAFPAVCRLRGGPSPLLGREPGEVDHACGNDLDTDAEKQERRQAGDDPNPFLSDESSKPVGVTVAE